MGAFITVFEKNSFERKKLEQAAKLMTEKSPRHYRYYVGECLFDAGQNWMWTTILTDDGDFGGFQALYPVNQEAIIMSSTPEKLEAEVDKVFADKYCPDKRRV